jgi:ribosomal protein S18 acetylase RimI-like enzyme
VEVSVDPYDRVIRLRRKTGNNNKHSEIKQVVARLTTFRTQLAPLSSLEGVLPLLLKNLSLGRAQIGIDHIRSAIDSKTSSRIVFVTLCDADRMEDPLAAAIAIQQSDADSITACDMASIVHAGLLKDVLPNQTPAEITQIAPAQTAPTQTREVLQQLSLALDRELETRGSRFLQWATDVSQTLDDSIVLACDALGFQSIGTLDYLSVSVPTSKESPLVINDDDQLRFQQIDWSAGEFQRFVDLVETTYSQTLDCPQMSAYRTAAQTLCGYQSSNSFDSKLWFTALDDRETPIGCVILANHQPGPSTDRAASPIIEIVYMGLVPEARGTGRGKTLVQHAFAAARSAGADRIILAVDQNNAPARAIYDLAGFEPMLSETVWAKLIGFGK